MCQFSSHLIGTSYLLVLVSWHVFFDKEFFQISLADQQCVLVRPLAIKIHAIGFGLAVF